jgi:hypothetical protein
LIAAGESRAATSTAKLSDVHLVTRSVGLPDSEARSALIEASRGGAPHLAAVGVWMAGSGFGQMQILRLAQDRAERQVLRESQPAG